MRHVKGFNSAYIHKDRRSIATFFYKHLQKIQGSIVVEEMVFFRKKFEFLVFDTEIQ